ncbi:MAG: dienelactone hydrolase family protein [Sphingobacteriaceae bacterium]
MKKTILAVLLTTLLSSGSAQTLKEIQYKDSEQNLTGLVTDNVNQSDIGVLILPAWMGIDREAKDAALSLQKEGYLAFVADIYGDGNQPQDGQTASKISSGFKTDFQAYQRRIEVALLKMRELGVKRVAVIGYCFGGTGALEVARGKLDVEGVVCIHGGLSKASDRENEPIHCKVLVEHPADDDGVLPAHVDQLVEELNQGNADWQMITYAHSKHTFTNPESDDYNPVMAKRAWGHTLMFLDEILKSSEDRHLREEETP